MWTDKGMERISVELVCLIAFDGQFVGHEEGGVFYLPRTMLSALSVEEAVKQYLQASGVDLIQTACALKVVIDRTEMDGQTLRLFAKCNVFPVAGLPMQVLPISPGKLAYRQQFCAVDFKVINSSYFTD